MQKEELKKEIEELKTIVMDHVRTASNLDDCIQVVEKFIEEENDSILDETERLHWETLLKITEES